MTVVRPPILLFGSPRSGTTWLARIFDSHPDTLYRHEPDTLVKSRDLPYTFGPNDLSAHIAEAQHYFSRLLQVTVAKANNHLPQFKKIYRSPLAQAWRLSIIYLEKTLEQLPKFNGLDRKMTIPDMVSNSDQIIPVIKSVDSLGRAPLFARAINDCRIVLIIRHPCGVVSSHLRGLRLGKMPKPFPFRQWLKLKSAQSRGLDEEALSSFTPLQTATYQWLLFNEYILDELSNDPRFHVVVYDDFCKTPQEATQALFSWCGLDFPQQTRDFIDLSLNYTGAQPRYFQIVRNPLEAANRWRSELSEDEQQEIADLVRGSPVSRYFYAD